jgi:hypothetical protein
MAPFDNPFIPGWYSQPTLGGNSPGWYANQQQPQQQQPYETINGPTSGGSSGVGSNPTPSQSPSSGNAGFAPSSVASGPQDYQSRLQTIMAPYQAMASQYANTLPGFRPNSPFQANHPQVASFLSNLLVAEANTGTGRTIGENIANVARGALAPAEMARQRQMQAAMMPFQMAMPQLQAEHEMASSDYMMKHGNYFDQMEQVRQQQADEQFRHNNAMESAKAQAGKFVQGSDGALYRTESDGVYNAVTGEKLNDNTVKLSPFQNARASGGTENERIWSQEDAERAAKGQPPLTAQEKQNWLVSQHGAMSGASDAATAPKKLDENYVTQEIANYKSDAPEKPMSENQFIEGKSKDLVAGTGALDKYNSYNSYISEKKQAAAAHANALDNWLKYRKQGDRTSIRQWLKAHPGGDQAGYDPDNYQQ